VFPANSHVIRPATADDAMALRQLAAASGASALSGRILVAEVDGIVAAAFARDQNRSLADEALAPPYLTAMLRLRASGVAAAEREPRLAERIRAAVLGPRQPEQLPLAA
jgi:hypothetical protein